MTPTIAVIVLVLLLAGLLTAAPLERNVEFYFLAIGILAVALARRFSWNLAWTRRPCDYLVPNNRCSW
ncbi:MAG TPA: DUF1646 family protein [Candidatus Binataceae bacterium]|nr:DUF1646 family protein [Candidatus Binataceae bacterium]